MNKIEALEQTMKKAKIADIRVGDTVRVHQKIREGNKTRVQVFEGLVIRYRKVNSLAAYLTVRKIASGVGVEKSWFVHSPNVEKIQVVKRSRVRRAFLTYMRERRGKSARLAEAEFDKTVANQADDRTAAQIADEEQKKIADEEQKLDGDKAAKDDALNQSDTEEIDTEVKKENKEAAKDDVNSAQDDLADGATADDKVNESGDDEAALPAEEIKEKADID
jgi:large subunit ribosomal protein L19